MLSREALVLVQSKREQMVSRIVSHGISRDIGRLTRFSLLTFTINSHQNNNCIDTITYSYGTIFNLRKWMLRTMNNVSLCKSGSRTTISPPSSIERMDSISPTKKRIQFHSSKTSPASQEQIRTAVPLGQQIPRGQSEMDGYSR